MCGFFGLQSFEFDKNQKVLALRNAIKLLNSRGPDSNNFILDDQGNLALSHNRLSILDLSQNGSQPMQSISGNFTIVYNGEIYNHLKLRKELERNKNFKRWKGTSDTETLLQAIEIWGIENTLQKINGMFSFAAWNKISKSLYLARDRFGEKPLYYGWISQINSFVFSSDLIFDKLFSKIKFHINEKALNELFHLNYVNGNHSIYKEFFKLNPGTYSEVVFKKNKTPEIKNFKYWDEDKIINKEKNLNYKENLHLLDLKLSEIVKNQIYADVEVGTFLSGGIDSSIITSKAQEVSSKKIKTFCIGVEDRNYDESQYAKNIAKYLGTDHEELIISEKDIVKEIPLILGKFNEPMGDSSFVPTYFVSKLAKQSLKVVLSGDGGDEIFGGYNRYVQLKNLSKIYNLPEVIKKFINVYLANMSEKNISKINQILKVIPFFRNQFYLNNKIKKLFDRIEPNLNFSEFIFNFLINKADLSIFQNSRNFSKKRIFEELNETFSETTINSHSIEEKMMYVDTKSYLPNDILFKVDRASMANSLETRAPFLDKDLYEFSHQLPINQKINNSEGKIILKNLLKTKIPQDLIDRPKGGFSIPISSWLNKPLLDWSENLLNKKNIEKSGLLDFVNINKIWSNHKKGIDNSNLIWSILVFQQWFMDR